MKRFNKRIPAFLMVMLVVLALTVPALAASAYIGVIAVKSGVNHP